MHDEDTSLIILFKGSLIGQQTFEFFYSVGFFTSSHLSILKKKSKTVWYCFLFPNFASQHFE